MPAAGRSLFRGFLVALALAAVLFWMPLLGPFAAGFAGGRRVEGPRRAVVATVLPGVVCGALFAVVFLGLDLYAALPGEFVLWEIAQTILVPFGGWVGGASTTRRAARARREAPEG